MGGRRRRPPATTAIRKSGQTTVCPPQVETIISATDESEKEDGMIILKCPSNDRRRRGRPCVAAEAEKEDVAEDETAILMEPPNGRRRGRPSKTRVDATSTSGEVTERGGYDFGSGGGSVPITVMKKLVKCLPICINDEKIVICSECGKTQTYWQFRLHNIQFHVNTAVTTDEKEQGLVMDHKYFARKLNEFKRLTKLTVFSCSKANCTSSFKSTLGLAYHMNTCGRSKEELDAVLLECETCKMKLTLPNMQWHRKTHEERNLEENSSSNLSNSGGNKRKSALIARRSFKRAAAAEADGDGRNKSGDEGADDDEWNAEDEGDGETGNDTSSRKPKRKADRLRPILDLDSNDYTILALEFLDSMDKKGYKAWDDPPHVGEDPFRLLRIPENSLNPPPEEELETYLPDHKVSVEFKCTTGGEEDDSVNTSDYHRLNWFEGESVEITLPSSSSNHLSPSTSASIHHTGGPVLSMSWHPSGKLVAVSVGHSYHEEMDSLMCPTVQRRGCLQIYRRSGSVLNLELVLGIKWGYATHIQWSTFCPDIMDSYDPSVASCFDDVEIYARIGYLAMCCEDTTVRIVSFGIQDLKVLPNYEYKHKYKIKVYTKMPEIELSIDESVIEDPLGNAVKFDWHDENKYMAVGYANGFIAVYDLLTKSPLLVHKNVDVCDGGKEEVTVINPFWTFHGHRLGVRGVLFDPVNPRYLVTCGQDRLMKVWDLETRSERETKRTGICLDMCWVRGWIHQEASFENIVAYQSAMHNYVRIFQTGSGVGRPSSAEIFNVTSLSFHHGLTAQGTDDGKVNVTYYDWFWRECDYERNRKKKNLAVLSSVEVDPNSYEKLSADVFSVEVKKLKKSVLNSRLYQRLAVNDEEGVYSISLEAKFGHMNIFEPLPNFEDDVDDDGEGKGGNDSATLGGDQEEFSKREQDEYSELIVDEAINSTTKTKDGLIPIYDVKNPENHQPRLNISLLRKRPSTAIPLEGLEPHQVEQYIRFHTYLRINKVAWSPNGDVIAVGYRNGLVTLLPGTFESIFQT